MENPEKTDKLYRSELEAGLESIDSPTVQRPFIPANLIQFYRDRYDHAISKLEEAGEPVREPCYVTKDELDLSFADCFLHALDSSCWDEFAGWGLH